MFTIDCLSLSMEADWSRFLVYFLSLNDLVVWGAKLSKLICIRFLGVHSIFDNAIPKSLMLLLLSVPVSNLACLELGVSLSCKEGLLSISERERGIIFS